MSKITPFTGIRIIPREPDFLTMEKFFTIEIPTR